MKENKKGLNIMLSTQEKIEWDSLLAQTQIELGKTLTTKDFLLILMETFKNRQEENKGGNF